MLYKDFSSLWFQFHNRSSTAQRGFALSVLCANPYIVGDNNRASIRAETISIQRDLVLQGGLFEELTLTNYNTQLVEFELSLSFEADFADLFEILGKVRQQTGTKLRPVRLLEKTSEPIPVFNDGLINGEGEELTLAYQGVDQLLMESRIHFYQRRPDQVKGYTAIWQVTLQPDATQTLGYRLQPFLDNHLAFLVSIPATLHQAVAKETMEKQQWRDGVTCIRTDNQAFNQIIERAEQDTYREHVIRWRMKNNPVVD
ncbi:glycogen debranching N-terminal domain-containing protein [Leptothoe sp. PORK10 BA2]|uniref:glycogen debranching N-terminal domain-containing protein n=1 Tax=Leptothoe sp. PORK10 BA2 TaxID=3110254 RepID=UPI002B1FEB09|nr:glycogen debranching N-terminal domain-containing protein [Leptothoe sp. PORK10 BA2]MEA5464822.1 glycogen debranching N-terminal domain-containing protein [Leptothoe sp. PORK10 BA2]